MIYNSVFIDFETKRFYSSKEVSILRNINSAPFQIDLVQEIGDKIAQQIQEIDWPSIPTHIEGSLVTGGSSKGIVVEFGDEIVSCAIQGIPEENEAEDIVKLISLIVNLTSAP